MEGETTIQKSNKRQTQKTGNKQYYYVTIDQPADQLCHSQHQWGWHCETPPTGQVCLCMAENKKWHLVSVQQYRCAIAKMIHKILEVFLCFSDFRIFKTLLIPLKKQQVCQSYRNMTLAQSALLYGWTNAFILLTEEENFHLCPNKCPW